MKGKIGFLAIILVGLLAFSSCVGLRVNTELKRVGINFANKDSILKLEQDPALFKLWTSWRPIKDLMTKKEKKLVKKILEMQNSEEQSFYQEKFIEFFWKRRDDNSYDEKNGFKDNYYNRVVEAQTRFADKEDAQYCRKCRYGKGWETDLGRIYIVLGEPYLKERHNIEQLLSLMGYQGTSFFIAQEAEVWFYDFADFDIDDGYEGMLFQSGAAWILFEKDYSGYWEFGRTTFELLYNYENYMMSYFAPAMSFGHYMSEVEMFIKAVAESYIYDWDLEFEDVLVKWVPVK